MKDALQRVISASTLHQIRLLSVETKSSSELSPELQISMDMTTDNPIIQQIEGASFLLGRCSLKLESVEEPPSFFLAVTFEAKYQLNDPSISEDDCRFFVEHNVPYNLWPYFREFVQSITHRIFQSPVLLPLLKPAVSEQR